MNFPPFFIQALSIAGVVVGFELLLYLRRTRTLHSNKMVHRRTEHEVKENPQSLQTNKKRD